MTSSSTPDTNAQLLRALTSLKEMRVRLEAAESASSEPIAIIGMGCRLPGAANPDELWQLVRSGGDAITETPADRWNTELLFDAAPDAAGKVATRWGGFLPGIDRFDASFFGISPREAVQMDPQQRLLLEVAWETLEDGGQAVDRLAGSDTGVFVGVHSHSDDYYLLQAADPTAIDLYSGTGTSHSVASGRLSYVLDLRGPSLAIDTACSSSLVAVHLAVQSLRNRECSLAIAGGVNAIIEPTFTMVASRMRMMSPTGRCRPFDADGDGFVRSEGCATVLLKRLSDARADGDRVLAVIRGSAVNQDGRSNGLTAPNSLSQQAVITAALANGSVAPSAVDVVEAHGTGTPLGDPIEVEALAAVFGQATGGRTTMLGSVKANIGHTEGASGVAALIKTVLSLRAGEVAPMVHFRSLNPHISLAGTPLSIPTELTPWPNSGGDRVAGISSFGWSGTNAHVVIAQAPPDASPVDHSLQDRSDGHVLLLPISARSAGALHELAGAYRGLLRTTSDDNVLDICATAALRRSHHDHRLVITGRRAADLVDALDAHLAGHEHRGLATGVDSHRDRLLVFVFPGQGSQWAGMARDLMIREPVFRAAVERCHEAMAPFVDWSLVEVLSDLAGARLDEIDVVQPALFAMQVALAELWRSLGVTPDAVVGHSMGEVAAAHVAGSLSLDDAARVICVRSRLLRSIAGSGAMAVVDLDVEGAGAAIAGLEDRLSIAVRNSRSSTVLSGDPAALGEVLAGLERAGIFCRRVNVDVASHSPQVDGLLDDLIASLAPIRPRTALVPFMSTVTADVADGSDLDGDYWAGNLRRPVLFNDAVESLIADGHARFVEIAPHPVLVGAVRESLELLHSDGVAVASMHRDADARLDMRAAVGALYANGLSIAWPLVQAARRPTDLPPYPWQRERHWLDQPDHGAVRRGAQLDPLLGWQVPIADADTVRVWENRLTSHDLGVLTGDGEVLAAATLVELLLRAASMLGASALREVQLDPPLHPSGAATTVQVVANLGPDDTALTVHAVVGARRQRLAVARIPARSTAAVASVSPVVTFEVPTTAGRPGALATSLQHLCELVAHGAGAFTTVSIAAIDAPAATVVVDSPLECRLTFAAVDGTRATTRTADLDLVDRHGVVVLTAREVVVQVADLAGASIAELVHEVAWRPAPAATVERTNPVTRWVVATLDERPMDSLSAALAGAGHLLLGGAGPIDHALAAAAGNATGEHLGVVFAAAGARGSTDGTTLGATTLGVTTLDATTMATAQVAQVAAVLRLAAAMDRRGSVTLWIATCGAHSVVPGDLAPGFADTTLWGVGRAIGEEMPHLWGGCIELDSGSADDGGVKLAHELTHVADGAPVEGEVALRGQQRFVARLVPAVLAPSAPLRLGGDSTALVSGGFGAVGREVARWLVGEGARRLVLVGRTALPPRSHWSQLDVDSPAGRRAMFVRELEALGAAVHVAAIDVADASALRAWLEEFRAEGWPPVRSVFHAAAQFGGELIADVSDDLIRAQMLPKLIGAGTFHQMPELEHLVLFSSLAAVLPMAGQSAYAAGNAFLDGLADHRAASGLPAVSINWGFWEGSDEASADDGRNIKDTANALAIDQGMRGFRTEQGLAAMHRVMLGSSARAIVVPIDWNTVGAARVAAVAGLASDCVAAASSAAHSGAGTAKVRSLAEMLATASIGDRADVAEAVVRRIVGRVLKLPEDRIDGSAPFGSLGLDSLMSIELRNLLQREMGTNLSATVAWNYPSVRELAAYVLGRLVDNDGADLADLAEPATATATATATDVGGLAIDVGQLSDDEALAALLGGGEL